MEHLEAKNNTNEDMGKAITGKQDPTSNSIFPANHEKNTLRSELRKTWALVVTFLLGSVVHVLLRRITWIKSRWEPVTGAVLSVWHHDCPQWCYILTQNKINCIRFHTHWKLLSVFPKILKPVASASPIFSPYYIFLLWK